MSAVIAGVGPLKHAGPIGAAVAAETGGMIDGFEDGDMSEYTGDTSLISPSTNTVYNGTYALRQEVAGDGSVTNVHSSSGLDEYPEPGDTFQYRLNVVNLSSHRFYFGGSDVNNAYRVRIRAGGNDVAFEKMESGSLTTITQDTSASVPQNEWIKVTVEWGIAGSFTVTVEDSAGNQITQLTASDGTYTEGGVAFEANGAAGEVAYMDAADVTSSTSSNGTIVDDFEDGDIAEYGGATASYTVDSQQVWNGSQALHATDGATGDWISSTSGLDRYPSQGDTFTARAYMTDSGQRVAVAWATQSETEQPDGYYTVISANQEKALLKKRTGGTVTTLDSTSVSASKLIDAWISWEVEWTDAGEMTVTAYNEDTGEKLATLNATDTDHTHGGIAFLNDDAATDTSVDAWFDYYETTGVSVASEVNGTVVDQNGDPVANATVKVTGYDRSNYSGTASEITNEIERNRDEIETAQGGPTGWQDQGGTDYQLTGAEGHFENSSTYVAAHVGEEWELEGYQVTDDSNTWTVDAVDLTSPNVQVPAGRPVVLSLWDTSKDGFFQDQADEDLPGRTTSGTIVVEQIAPGGGVVSTTTHDTRPLVELVDVAANGGSKTHEAAVLDLGPGFYRVYPEGNEGAAYWIVVGDADQIVQPYIEDLRDENEQLTDRAQTIQDLKDNGKVVTTTVQADSSGDFSVDLGPRYDEVTLVAYRAPPELDGANVTRREIIQYYESFVLADDGSLKATVSLNADQKTSYWDETGVPSSYYVSAGPEDTSPPAGDVEVEVAEVSAPPVANASTRQTIEDELRDLIDELRMSDVPSSTQEVIQQVPISDLRNQYAELVGLLKKYEPARERYLELSSRDSIADPSELSRSELETETAYANQALYEVDLTGGVEEPDVERTNDTVSVAWTVPDTDLESANVSVLAHWTNGTTDVVNESYVTIDSSVVGDDVVRVNEYPVGEKDPAAVQFELRVAGDGEYRQRADTVENPTFSGDLPELDSVRLSSTVPGPNDNVTVTFNPAESGSYKSLSGVTVYGPDGSTVSSTSPSGNAISFTTDGAGLYTVKADLETTGGETITVPIRFKASETDLARPPTVTVRDSTVGTYALVGGPVEDAEVTTQGAGDQVTVLAQVAEGEDPPDQLDVHLEELALPGTATTNVRVVQGDDQENVPGRVSVKIHYRSAGDSYQVRAHGEPVTESGTTYGQAVPRDGGLVVKTWTQEDGSLEVKKVNNPTLRQRGAFWIDKQLLAAPSLGIPIAITPPALPAGIGGGLLLVAPVGLLAGRRRWSR